MRPEGHTSPQDRVLTVILNEHGGNNPIHILYESIEKFDKTESCYGNWKFVRGESAIPVNFHNGKVGGKLGEVYKTESVKLCKNNRKE